MSRETTDADVLIVGGGLVGSLLACALAELQLRVVLVETRRVDVLEQPSFDSRATALANGSRRVLAQLGLWDDVRAEAQAIRHIHIGERGRFGAARIAAGDEGVDALGFTVENRVLGTALWNRLQTLPELIVHAPATVESLAIDDQRVRATINGPDGTRQLTAGLLVAADGARSPSRDSLGISAQIDDYAQSAVIVNCTVSESHRGRAFERFTAGGPLALLPLTRDRMAVVWVQPTAAAAAALALDDNQFRAALQEAFGYRLGCIEQIGCRDSHPLYRVRSDNVVGQRTVLIGNAAVALHPVAGQGFNLALRDVAALAELIAARAAQTGTPVDVGNAGLLADYRAWRTADQRRLAAFTHALVRGFGNDLPGMRSARSAGLILFDLMPGAKSYLARQTMGLAGRVPRLARGLGLHG